MVFTMVLIKMAFLVNMNIPGGVRLKLRFGSMASPQTLNIECKEVRFLYSTIQYVEIYNEGEGIFRQGVIYHVIHVSEFYT